MIEKVACVACGGIVGCTGNPNTETRWQNAYCKVYSKVAQQIDALYQAEIEKAIKENNKDWAEDFLAYTKAMEAEREKVRKEERERIIKWLSGHQVSDSAKGSNFELTCDDWVKLKGNVSTGQE